MPKATMDKYRFAAPDEREVGRTGQILTVQPKTETE